MCDNQEQPDSARERSVILAPVQRGLQQPEVGLIGKCSATRPPISRDVIAATGSAKSRRDANLIVSP